MKTIEYQRLTNIAVVEYMFGMLRDLGSILNTTEEEE